MAANHQSYLDPPVLGFSLKRPSYYIAKYELFSNRLMGWLLATLHAIPIKRSAADLQAYKKAINLLLSGECLVLFPEGTRSRGDQFLEPKLGVGLLALAAKVPIVPVYLKNTRGFWKTFFKKSISVRFGKPIEPDWLKRIPADRSGYQKVAQEIMRRIEALKSRLV